jgi:hypothetical protein
MHGTKIKIIRKLVIRIANYPKQVGLSVKHFLAEIVLHLLRFTNFLANCAEHSTRYIKQSETHVAPTMQNFNDVFY